MEMNNERRTYGVMGMLEWHTVIKAGRSRLRLRFEGGSLSGYGTTPATFSTSNAAAQRIIEQSNEFLSGRIRLLRRETIAATHSGGAVSGKKRGRPRKTEALETPCKEIVRIANLHDARNHLINECGIDGGRLLASDDIAAAAASCGVAFEGCRELECKEMPGRRKKQ